MLKFLSGMQGESLTRRVSFPSFCQLCCTNKSDLNLEWESGDLSPFLAMKSVGGFELARVMVLVYHVN